MRLSILIGAACLVAGCASCDDNDDGPPKGGISTDGGAADADWPDAGQDVPDFGASDADQDGSNDGGGAPDAEHGDVGTTGDSGSMSDGGSADAESDAGADMNMAVCGNGTIEAGESCDDGATTDCITTHDGGDGTCAPAGTCSPGFELDGSGNCQPNTTGLSTPCSNGAGQALFKFHYDNGSTSARIDVWDASCSYSFANQACNVREVYPGFGDLDRTSQGYPVCTSSEYIRVRYSVAGIPFTRATLYVQARSYATASSTSIEAWSPIYGSMISGLVDNDFVYDWYAIDWSNHLSASDDPNLTAIQLYAYQGSNRLAVQGVELCLE